jgi:putative ABC transport system permease protein
MLTVLGMGIGFGAILFLVSLGYGLQGALLQNITSSGLDVTPNEQEGKILNSVAVEDIKKISGVTGVETSYDFKARLKIGDKGSDVRAIIASPGYIELEKLKVVAGSSLAKDDSKKILVTSAVAKAFGKSPEELVGQNISFLLLSAATGGASINADGYAVAGVVEGEDAVFHAVADGLNITAGTPYAKVKAKTKSSEIMGAVRDAISQEGFAVSSLETVSEVNKLFGVANIVLGLFGIITLAVSAIGMFNTMTVALLERTTEIGIMRSIGASRTDILLMFIIESTLMGFCGGVAGIVLGVASGQIVNLIVNIAAKYMGGKSLVLFAYPLWFLGFVLAFSIVIGFATGIGPAKRASSLDPLEALRSR